MRSKKAAINTSLAILSQIVSIVCGFILPRLILGAFGSSYNGITSSITQFISCVVLLRAGIGGVTRAALYKPLSENDHKKISGIVNATSIFMKKVALIFAAGLIVFACVYPLLVSEEFDWFFSFTLVLILGINTFAQNYFGITYQILIQADQRHYVFSAITIITTILNTVIAFIMIRAGATIHVVKLGSALVFLLNPILLNLYVNQKYKIDKNVPPDNFAISQRWDAFAQQVAVFVNNNVDVIIITAFCNIKEVSVYTVYHMVTNGLFNIERTISNGMDAAFGNMLAKKEDTVLQKNFRVFEFMIFNLSAFLFICGGLLIVPFVQVYTHGITDVPYTRVAFGVLACINQFMSCVRLPYQMIVEASGHFKQTRNGAVMECIINIVISAILVIKYGLIGVAIGTFCAMVFRTLQYTMYSSKHILHRRMGIVFKHYIISFLQAVTTVAICYFLPLFNGKTYWDLFQYAVIIVIITMVVLMIYIILFNREELLMFIGKINGMFNSFTRKKSKNGK